MAALTETKNEWVKLPISRLAKFSRGVSWRKTEESNDGALVISIPNIKDGKIDFESKYNHYISKRISDDKKLHIGDIIFVGSSGSIHNVGRNAIINFLPNSKVAFASFTFKAEPNLNFVYPLFLYFLCNSSQVPFPQYTKRSADGKFNFQLRDFEKNLILNVPTIQEQKKIVRILTAAREAIAEQEELVVNLKELKRSMMQFFFTHGTKGEKTKMTEIGEIPESWAISKFGDVCEFTRGPFGGSLKKEIFVKNGIAVYEQSHAIHGNLNSFRYFISEDKFNEMKRFEVHAGDLIMSCSGTFGKIQIIPENQKKGIINQALLKLKPLKILPMYLKLLLESPFFQNQLKSNTLGVAIQNVASVTVLKNFEVAIPSINEQQEISNAVIATDKKIKTTQEKLSAYQNLFKTLLHELMSGKRRVKL